METIDIGLSIGMIWALVFALNSMFKRKLEFFEMFMISCFGTTVLIAWLIICRLIGWVMGV